jgi:hypothetical protein
MRLDEMQKVWNYQLSCSIVSAKMYEIQVKIDVFSSFLLIFGVNAKSPFVIRWN